MPLRYAVEGARATLIIDDPERRNPLTSDTMAALREGVVRSASDPNVRAIVITGSGDRAFSAGGDLGGGFVDDPVASHGSRGALADLIRTLRTCGVPTVARVNGHALGGGFGLAVACDIVIATEHATLGTPEIDVGLWPMMIAAVVTRAMPRKAALEMMMTGRRLSAAEARDLGLVSRVVAAAELDAVVDEVVASLARRSRAVLALGKDAFYAIDGMDLDTALDHLHVGLTAVAATDDAAEGVTAFLEKRSPHWTDR